MKIRTPAQLRAIRSTAPDILCVAGPGSGKTTVLVDRITRLMDENTDPKKMVVLTFTNAAANELGERLGVPIPLGYCGTLHGFALRMLKQYGEAIGYGSRLAVVDEDTVAELVAANARSLGCKTQLDKLVKMRREGIMIFPMADGVRRRYSIDEMVVLRTAEEMRISAMVDFDLILTEFARLLRQAGIPTALENTFTHLFVDEVQDSGTVDWEIFHWLPIANKFYVGDPDQSIFAFRGGRPELMVQYASRSAVEVITLQENFRSTVEICDTANSLISHNLFRIPKVTISASGPIAGSKAGVAIFAPEINEGAEISTVLDVLQSYYANDDGSVAVLARTNHLANEFRRAIKAAGFPVAEAVRYDVPVDWKTARSLVELLAQPENDTLFFSYLLRKNTPEFAHGVRREAARAGKSINQFQLVPFDNTPLDLATRVMGTEVISAESRATVASLIRQLPAGSDLLDLALAMGQYNAADSVEESDGVTVTTFHSSKGREFDVVFIVGAEDEIIPGTRKETNIEEERRLFYVALTRARHSVYITSAQQRVTSWGATVVHKPSRFILETKI